MSGSSEHGFVDPRGQGDGELSQELLQTVRYANRLRHLYDIFRGDTEAPVWYYEDGGASFNYASRWASNLASSFPEESVQFLNRVDAEFNHHNLKRNAVVDFLAEEGISRHVSEELEPSWMELLLLAYHALYDPDKGRMPRYDLLLAKSRLFKFRSKLTYGYDDLNLDDLEARVTAFVRSKNRANSRPLSIRCYLVDSEEFVLDFYQESARVAQPVFDIREDEDDADPLEPDIKYDSLYSIKTLSANIGIAGDQYEVTYSKSINNWKNLLEDFMGDVFDKTAPFDDGRRKRSESVEEVLKSAYDVLEQDSASDEDVIDAVDAQINQISETAATSEAAEEAGFSDGELADIYDSIELVGINVQGVEEALTDTFRVSSTATLRDWTAMNVSDNDSLKRVVADADPEEIGFLFRGCLRGENNPPEEFVLQDGVWKSGAGGISDDATEHLNILFQSHDG